MTALLRHEMEKSGSRVRARLDLLGALVLLVGLAGAILIYQRAENGAGGAVRYEEGSGGYYPITPEDSKKYLRDMELYGGKANVIADAFKRWFVGLWQGKSLAYIVGCIAVITSFGVFYLARHLPSRHAPFIPSQNSQDGVNKGR